jgi:hypothetical protein
LILHHPRLASLFKAEFEKRWSELTVGVRQPEAQVAVVSPNPTSEMLQIQALQSAIVGVKVLDVLGREVLTVWPDDRSETVQILVSNLKSGSYIALIQTQDAVGTVPFQKI